MKLRIKERINKTKNIYSLIFEKPNNFNFYAGQYLDITLNTSDRFKSREFTIASSPTEDFLMITTKKGESEFKKALEKLRARDLVETTHPAGTFTLDETTPSVFIAGGIGITPFRSIIKYVLDNKLNSPVTLVYSNSTDDFLFKEELDEWSKQLPNLIIHYINTSKNGRLNKTKLATAAPKNVNNIYYLVGRSSFVDSMEKILLKLGVDETNIRYDRFTGYY